MKRAVAWFVENGVTPNLLMILIVAAGVLTIPGLRKEIFPELSIDTIAITVEYPGAAPVDVEQAICTRIEEAIYGLEGIKRIRSTASEGVGTVLVEVEPGYDIRRLLDDVKTRVDSITTFPEEAEEPQTREILARSEVLSIAVWGATQIIAR